MHCNANMTSMCTSYFALTLTCIYPVPKAMFNLDFLHRSYFDWYDFIHVQQHADLKLRAWTSLLRQALVFRCGEDCMTATLT